MWYLWWRRRKLAARLAEIEARERLFNEYLTKIMQSHLGTMEQVKSVGDRLQELVRSDFVKTIDTELKTSLLQSRPITAQTGQPAETYQTPYQTSRVSTYTTTTKPDISTPVTKTTHTIPQTESYKYTSTREQTYPREDKQPSLTEVKQREKIE